MKPFIRRTFDVVLSAAGLVVLFPLIAAAAVAVRLSMGSPVLFRQVRTGYKGRPFMLLKFRTMLDATGPDGKPLDDFERLTPLGNWLRRTSVDELPQLWNILRGDMSLVGPRPLVAEYATLYTPEQARRHDVKPGLTGWAQVRGRNTLSWEEKFRLDVWYVDRQGLGLDLWILLLTVKKVLVAEGVNQSGSVTMEPFRGSAVPGARAGVAGHSPFASDLAADEDIGYAL